MSPPATPHAFDQIAGLFVTDPTVGDDPTAVDFGVLLAERPGGADAPHPPPRGPWWRQSAAGVRRVWGASGRNGWHGRACRTLLPTLRQARLFAAASCRQVWHLMRYEDSRAAVRWVEAHAGPWGRDWPDRVSVWGGAASLRAMGVCRGILGPAPEEAVPPRRLRYLYAARAALWATEIDAADSGLGTLVSHVGTAAVCDARAGGAASPAVVAAALGEFLVGLSGPGWTFDPTWRTHACVALARAVYAGPDWSLLPVLADALEDAGCEAGLLLTHLRGPGPFCRGLRILDELARPWEPRAGGDA